MCARLPHPRAPRPRDLTAPRAAALLTRAENARSEPGAIEDPRPDVAENDEGNRHLRLCDDDIGWMRSVPRAGGALGVSPRCLSKQALHKPRYLANLPRVQPCPSTPLHFSNLQSKHNELLPGLVDE